MRRAAVGHSLIELMVATTVLAVLASAAVPAWRESMARRTVEVRVESFRSAARMARRLAQEWQTTVTLCALDPASPAADLACRASGTDWSGGWLVFVDAAPHGRLDDGDRLIHVDLPSGPTGRVTGTRRHLSFEGLGVSLTAASRFTFLPPGAPPGATRAPGDLLVCINKPGRARVVDGDAC